MAMKTSLWIINWWRTRKYGSLLSSENSFRPLLYFIISAVNGHLAIVYFDCLYHHGYFSNPSALAVNCGSSSLQCKLTRRTVSGHHVECYLSIPFDLIPFKWCSILSMSPNTWSVTFRLPEFICWGVSQLGLFANSWWISFLLFLQFPSFLMSHGDASNNPNLPVCIHRECLFYFP